MGAMQYAESIDWLFSLHRFGMKLGLANMEILAEGLGRPQDRFGSVLVAGTNGKGSTAAMLHQILVVSGLRSGLYTSPHLVRTEERIRLGDREILPVELAEVLSEVRAAIETLLAAGKLAAHPTFFEAMTGAALLAFARAGTEIAVLEVGLGGRLDATNIVDPLLSVITNIDLDHQEQLGTTLAGIAREKAGVLRRGAVGLVGESRAEPLDAIRDVAASVGARVVVAWEESEVAVLGHAGQDGSRNVSSGGHGCPERIRVMTLRVTTPSARYERIECPLLGDHQTANVLLAVRGAELLGDAPRNPLRIPPEMIVAGIRGTRWPGRLEWVGSEPALLLDGAHNAAGCWALAAYLEAARLVPVLLFGAMRDKDYAAMLKLLLPRVGAAVLTSPPIERAAAPEELLAAARGLIAGGLIPGTAAHRGGFVCEARSDAGEGLARARELAGGKGTVLVAGSLFLVGAIKERVEAAAVRVEEPR
jgi:dihydrofolate synthase/folylpolyglutamate synthase